MDMPMGNQTSQVWKKLPYLHYYVHGCIQNQISIVKTIEQAKFQTIHFKLQVLFKILLKNSLVCNCVIIEYNLIFHNV
jgi:hypothetical protein